MVISEEGIAKMPAKKSKKMNPIMNNTMKKTHISRLALFFAAGLALVSCAKEITETPVKPDDTAPEYTTITLTATHPEMTETGAAAQEDGGTAAVSTKTVLDKTTGSVSWEAGDRLKLVYEDGSDFTTEALTEADLKNDGKTATFKATVPAGKALKWAVYPADIESELTTDGKFSVTVPQVQDGTFRHASIEVGEIGEGSNGNEGTTIALKNVCALLKFTVADANADAATVFIGGNGAPLNGKAGISAEILAVSYTLAEDVPDYHPNVEVSVNGKGTYYAAILPAKTTGLSMQIYSADNTLLAENISSNVLDAPRKTIKDLGTLRSTPFANKRFVTPDGAGKRDGSSWENAFAFTDLSARFRAKAADKVDKLSDHIILMSEGTFRTAANTSDANGLIQFAAGTKFQAYGGYSAESAGTDITGRDLNKFKTNFAGKTPQGDNARLFYYTDATIETIFDGVGFTETYQKAGEDFSGTCLLIGAVKKAYFVNCRIDNNKKDGNAVVRVGNTNSKESGTVATATFERCTFSNNTVSGKGLIQVQKGGNLTVRDCDFSQGNTVSGEDPNGAYKDKYRVCYKTRGIFTFEGDNKFAADQFVMSGQY